MRVMYQGDIYSYEPWDEVEYDNVKVFHDVFLIERDMQGDFAGKKRLHPMPLGPYSRPDSNIFRMWIECGMPTKKDMGLMSNADLSDIVNYYNKWIDDEIDKELLGD